MAPTLRQVLVLCMLGCVLSCSRPTSEEDVTLAPNEVIYVFEFEKADKQIADAWIEPHMASLYGHHYRSTTQRPMIGNQYKFMCFVRVDDEGLSEAEIRKKNDRVLESLGKKVKYTLSIRIGGRGT